MILMATDHASAAFNAHRYVTDSAFLYAPGSAIPTLEFLYRWASHLCAPTFLFLAGASLAMSVQRRQRNGVPESRIDRDLLVRGLLILGVDLTLISWLWFPGSILLQVMYAIGLSMVLMIPLRRLPAILIAAIAGLVIVGAELLSGASLMVPNAAWPIAKALLLDTGMISFSGSFAAMDLMTTPKGVLFVGYPLLPWWAMMGLGWILGAWVVRAREAGEGVRALVRPLLAVGMLGLALFFVVRGFNAYGNMHLLRDGGSVLQWLHVSKYSPSISYTALEIGIMALILAGLLALQTSRQQARRLNNPVLVFGQTAFFFYIVHILVLEGAARALGMHKNQGLGAAMVASMAALLVLYPLCRWYRGLKATHPESWLRYF